MQKSNLSGGRELPVEQPIETPENTTPEQSLETLEELPCDNDQ